MDMTFIKTGSLYEVKLQILKLNLLYVAHKDYPFMCHILTTDNKLFSCVVRYIDASTFLMAKQNDILMLRLSPVYDQSDVMGVISCQNLSRNYTDLGEVQKNDAGWFYFSFSLNIERFFLIPMMYTFDGGQTLFQNKYYCLIEAPQDSFVACSLPPKFLPDLLAVETGDTIKITLEKFNDDDKYVLQCLINETRKVTYINHTIHLL